MRRVAGILYALCGSLAVSVVGIAQGSSSVGLDETQRYELLVQQPNPMNSGMTWWRLAMLYQDKARYSDAERAYLKASELLRLSDATTQASLTDSLGTLYMQMGRYPEAEQLEKKALAMREAQKDSLGIGQSWMHLAMLSLGQHRNADGEMYAELAVERLVPERGTKSNQEEASPEQKMTALTYLSLARCANHNCSDAVSPLRRALTIAERDDEQQSFPTAYITFLEGYVEWKRGDMPRAARLMKRGTQGMEAQLGWGHPTFVSAMRQYQRFLALSGHEPEAAEISVRLAQLSRPQPAASSALAEGVPALR